jgi:hypothetical protein
LTLYVDEVFLHVRELAEDLIEIDRLGFDLNLPREEADCLSQTSDWINIDPFHNCGLGGVCRGYKEAVSPLCSRLQRHRENSLDRTGLSCQSEFANDCERATSIEPDLTVANKHPKCNRQVEPVCVFLQIGWSQVDHDPSNRP